MLGIEYSPLCVPILFFGAKRLEGLKHETGERKLPLRKKLLDVQFSLKRIQVAETPL